MARRYYWYVTYTFRTSDKLGDGSLMLDSPEDWFPIEAARKYIVENHVKGGNAIISGWQRMNAKQVREFRGSQSGTDSKP